MIQKIHDKGCRNRDPVLYVDMLASRQWSEVACEVVGKLAIDALGTINHGLGIRTTWHTS